MRNFSLLSLFIFAMATAPGCSEPRNRNVFDNADPEALAEYQRVRAETLAAMEAAEEVSPETGVD